MYENYLRFLLRFQEKRDNYDLIRDEDRIIEPMMARSEAYHPLRNSVHVQDGGCSLLLTCTAPDSVSAVSLLPSPSFPPLAEAALPFPRRER